MARLAIFYGLHPYTPKPKLMVFRWLQTTDNQADLIISGGLVSGIDDIYININTAVNYILYASTTA
jgi:hypothetical protein